MWLEPSTAPLQISPAEFRVRDHDHETLAVDGQSLTRETFAERDPAEVVAACELIDDVAGGDVERGVIEIEEALVRAEQSSHPRSG